jgi:hypothetical protein
VAGIAPQEYERRLRLYIQQDLFAQKAGKHAGLLARVKEEQAAGNLAAEKASTAARLEYERERDRFFLEISLYEINAFLGRITGKKPVGVREPAKRGGYGAGVRAAIVGRLANPKNPGAKKLQAIRTFILNELFKPIRAERLESLKGGGVPAEPKRYPPARSCICDADLRRLVAFMGEKVGTDLTLPVLHAYNSAMPAMLKGWVDETARVTSRCA